MRILAADLMNRKEIIKSKGVNVLVNGKSRSGKTELANEIYNYYLNRQDYNPVLLNGVALEGFFNMSRIDSYRTCKIPTHSGQHIVITKSDDERPFFIRPQKYQRLFVGNKYLVKGKTLGESNNVIIIDNVHALSLKIFLCLTEFLSVVFANGPLFICIGNGRVYNGQDNLFNSVIYKRFPIVFKRFNLIPLEKSTFDKQHPKLEENYLNSFNVLPENQINLLPVETYNFIKRRSRKINYDPYSLPSGLIKQYCLPSPGLINHQYLYISNSYEDIESINASFIKVSGLPIYRESPDLSLFTESEKRLLGTLCKRKIRTIELIMSCPVTFKNNGQLMYGLITSIEQDSSSGGIKAVSVVCNNQTYHIVKKEFKLKDSNKSFSYLPIDLAWCVNLSSFNPRNFNCDNALVINKGMRMFVFEEYINKTDSPNFINTYYINQRNFLKPNYVEFMSISS